MTCLPCEVVALGRRLRPVFQEYPTIAAVYLFGSVSRGTDSAGSDVDFGLLLDQDEPGIEHHRFLGDLAARLEAFTAPRPIDLVVLNVQGPVFCHEVILEGQLIYEGNQASVVG